jgi:two-component system, sensor histidine kinase and response regulator
VDAWIRGDRGRLRQALTNLMANAIKFTDRGEVVVRAKAEAQAEAHVCLRFTISDTGIGFDPDEMGRLFQPFSQADASTSRRYGGSGLGLAISRHLAQAMGGQIGAESAPGRGSTFWFTVVMEPAPPDAAATIQSPPGLQGRRVLIVDDNTTNRQILHEQLASFAIVSAQASGGPEALAQLEGAARSGCPFELAILDLHMPGMDGVQLGTAIRANPWLASTVLVLLGSMSHQASADELKARGFAAWAGKPVGRSHLRRLLTTAFAGTVAAPGGAAAPPATGPRPSAPAAPVPAPEGRPALRVLVAEDSKANQLVAIGMLEKMGHSARLASDGAEAIAAVEAEPFDLILMDVQMPKVDGLHAAAAIRALEAARGTRTPIVAVTAHAVRGDRERCLAAGMDAYLSKPLRRQELARIIDDVFPAGPVRAPTGPERAPEARSPRAVLDREAALARLEGDEALFAALVDVFLEEWPELLAKIRVALAAGDLPAVGHQAHRLCGLAKTFDAPEAADAAARLEGVAAEGDRAAVADAAAEVEAQLTRLQDALADLHGPRATGGR